MDLFLGFLEQEAKDRSWDSFHSNKEIEPESKCTNKTVFEGMFLEFLESEAKDKC